jgi:hypothetical protein
MAFWPTRACTKGGWQPPRPRRRHDGRRLILPSVRHPRCCGWRHQAGRTPHLRQACIPVVLTGRNPTLPTRDTRPALSLAHCRAMGFYQCWKPSLVVGRCEQEAHRSRLSPPGLTCRDRGGLARSASTWSREMTALTARFGDAASWLLTVSMMPQHPAGVTESQQGR